MRRNYKTPKTMGELVKASEETMKTAKALKRLVVFKRKKKIMF